MTTDGSNPQNRDADLMARLDRLSGSIKAEMGEAEADRKSAEAKSANSSTGRALANGLRVASELLAGVLVGAFAGWWIDRWLGSAPFALLVLTLVGTIAGFWNVYRFAARPTGGKRGRV